MIVWFATGNIHKKEELSAILRGAIPAATAPGVEDPAWEHNIQREVKIPWELKIPNDACLAFEPEETGNSFLENALIKAGELWCLLEEKRPNAAGHAVWRQGDPVIADDSGLCVDALGGRPGIHSARYGGRELPAAEKNALLLAELGNNPRRSARFVCAMVLYYGPNRFFAAQETLEGELVLNPDAARGRGGFGYDPILRIPELGRTVAELSDEEKNRISHRGKAGRAIGTILAGIALAANGIGRT